MGTYKTAHNHVVRSRGRASGYQCIAGCGRMATQWSYRGGDPDELAGMLPSPVNQAKQYPATWSMKVSFYDPMCAPCHVARDRGPVTHCKNGHAFDDQNTRTIPHPRGRGRKRVCRACESAAVKRYRERKVTR